MTQWPREPRWNAGILRGRAAARAEMLRTMMIELLIDDDDAFLWQREIARLEREAESARWGC